MKFAAQLIFLSIALSGCVTIYFTEPQPSNTTSLDSFPERIRGMYKIDEEDEKDTFLIEATRYVYPEVFEKHIPRDQLDSIESIYIENSLLFDNSLPDNEGIEFRSDEDSIHYKVTLDVAKSLSENFILKKHKRFLVLSEREIESDYWNVYLVEQLKNGNLIVWTTGNFQTEEDNPERNYDGKLEDYYPIVAFEKIGKNQYLISPTKGQFKKLIKKGLFVELSEYEKIN